MKTKFCWKCRRRSSNLAERGFCGYCNQPRRRDWMTDLVWVAFWIVVAVVWFGVAL